MGDYNKHAVEQGPLDTLRHSTAHLLAIAVTELFPGTRYAIGPPVQDGFYYDFDLDSSLSADDLQRIEDRMHQVVAEGRPFIRQEVDRLAAMDLFGQMGQVHKVEILSEIGDPAVTLYRTGDFIDLCRGPHVDSTKDLGCFKLLRLAGAYWRGDEKRPMLQRIYGTAWFEQSELEAYLDILKEAERRDHRRLGREMRLFMLDDRAGQGLPLWLPKGTMVRELLEQYLIRMERARGYQHVRTPSLARDELYQISGHRQLYSESMYPVLEMPDGERLSLRPMNCPHHILIYQSELHSYRQLPVRLAELGANYRFEKSGELSGLSRVRSFVVNDAHIFCTAEQLEQEIIGALRLILKAYNDLGISDYWFRLSLRDQGSSKWIGSDEMWQSSQEALGRAVADMGLDVRRAEGEAAFYGPKIDVQVRDALRREFTVSTVQVDFNLPERFDLSYIDESGQKIRPVMVHRASIGSIERMVAFLIEQHAGDFPLWLAPVQVIILPTSERVNDFAIRMVDDLLRQGVRAELDLRDERVGRKIRDAEMQRIPFMAVVGPREQADGTMSVRRRGVGDLGQMMPGALVELLAGDQPEP